MKKWQLCLFALSIIATACAEDESGSSSQAPPTETPPPDSTSSSSVAEPTPPIKLDVAHMSSTSVFLRWEWTEDGTGLANAEFEITATPEGGAPKTMRVVGKLFAVLDGLQKGKIYNVVVAHVRADGTMLGSDPLRVELRAIDFQKPILEGNKAGAKTDPNSVPYTTVWSFKEDFPSAKGLTAYEILYCKSSCEEQRADKGQSSSSKDLDYYTNYTVLVAAVMGDASGAEIKLASSILVLETIKGQPQKVENLSVDQKPDTLNVNISWLPPNQPNGKIESYNLEIFAGDKNFVNENLKATTYTYSIKTKDQVVETLDISVKAINNGNDNFRYGLVTQMPYALQKPAPPTELKLKTCETDSIGIEVVRQSNEPLKFQVVYASNQTLLSDTPVVTLAGFQTYQEVPVSVAACVPLEGENILCGVDKSETFRTNVVAPTKVRNLSFVEGEAKLTWEKPETPGGPINGYVVRITDKSKREDSEAEVKDDVTSYEFTGMKNCTKYVFYVVAYNNDVLTGAKVNGALSDAVSYTSVNCDASKNFPTWAIVLIVLVILGGAGGGVFYYMKYHRNA